MKKTSQFFYLLCCLAALAGCRSSTNESPWQQIKHLHQEKTDLAIRVEQLEKENTQLKEQVNNLAAISPQTRLEAISTLRNIEFTRRSGLYDQDKDGRKETLLVYIRPTDTSGDTVKPVGKIQLQLWDLNRPAQNALLAEWTFAPEQLKTLWIGTIMTDYYRITIDVGKLLDGNEKELTVKATFNDYLSGRELKAQKVITP